MTDPKRKPQVPEVRENPVHPMSGFFEPLRRARREHYASRTPRSRPPKRRAVQTMVHNEPVFFPVWLRYYSRFFAPEDIYVLDNGTTDGSTAGSGFVRIPVTHDSVDHAWMARTLADHQRELFNHYGAVLTTDVDEIVAPLPEWGPLDAYIDRLDESFVNCFGYEILHLRDREAAYRPDLPVLAQRRYWFANDGYDKPALATEPMSWEPGLHTRTDGRLNFDPDLRLIHLHRMDYDICLERHRLRRAREWNAHDIRSSWASHNRLVDGPSFDRWFYRETGFSDETGIEIALERIPRSWGRLF